MYFAVSNLVSEVVVHHVTSGSLDPGFECTRRGAHFVDLITFVTFIGEFVGSLITFDPDVTWDPHQFE